MSRSGSLFDDDDPGVEPPGPPALSSFWDDGQPSAPPHPGADVSSPRPPRRWGRRARAAGAVLVLGATGWAFSATLVTPEPRTPDTSAAAADPALTPSLAPTRPQSPTPTDTPQAPTATPTATPTVTKAPSALDAAALLATLEVKGRAQHGDYDRDLFGQAWLDVDRNGCDTRNDVLRRDLVDVVLKPDTNGCAVLRGTLVDPYTGVTIYFERGPNSSEVQIDHVVAIADAWQKGARTWTDERRAEFANDPLNLLAVDGPTNQAKQASDAATWLPPNRGYWCEYAARIVAVKSTYDLWVTPAEAAALDRILDRCPGQEVPQEAT